MDTELDNARDRLSRQESKLDNARETVRASAKRAKKLIDSKQHWRLFQVYVYHHAFCLVSGRQIQSNTICYYPEIFHSPSLHLSSSFILLT